MTRTPPTTGAGSPKTVLYIIKPERTAGAEMVLAEAARRLNPGRYRPLMGLLTPDRDGVIPPALPTVDFRMPLLNGPIWVKFFFQLCWVIRRHRVKILHVNSYVPGNYARAAAQVMRVPIIIDHWHGFTRFTWKRRLICRMMGRGTDLSLAVSETVRRHLVEQGGLNPDRVRVVHNGVDQTRVQQARPRQEVRAALGLAPDAQVVGLVGRLDHWGKGHRELFEALAELRPRYPRLQALLVGGGRRLEDMRLAAHDMGLAAAVHFLGNREDVPDLLAAMDIFALPSYSEGVSLALLEAMAAGLPVIASEVGGLPEVVQHEKNGLLIPPRDSTALVQALETLLADPILARHLAQRGQGHVAAHYSLDRLGMEINDIYDELSAQKRLRE
jgi:glycosyltransferase involved in cell wall biosynthesis